MSRLHVVLVVVVLVALAALTPEARPQATYSDRYDQVDVDAIIANQRLLDGYLKCFLADDDSACDAMGKDVKAVLSEALATNCAKCTNDQKDAMRQVVRHLTKTQPDVWEKIQQKHDPARAFAKANPQLFP